MALRIGFVGLGIMGRPMAGNLRKAGFPLSVFNRSPGKTRELVQQGAQEVRSPREAAERSDVVIVNVTDTPDVEDVIFGPEGIAAGARSGMLVIDMSTIRPEAARSFARRLSEKGIDFLDAPVSGGDVGAREGTLTIMVGGTPAAFERARPIFETLGRRVTHVGPSGSGQAVKACNQILCALHMIGACEALSLARQLGIDMPKLFNVITAGAGNSWAFQNLGPRIAAGDLDPGFMIRLIQKDLAIVLEEAKQKDLPLPGTALAAQLFRAVQAEGGGDLGTQAMIRAYEKLGHFSITGQLGKPDTSRLPGIPPRATKDQPNF